MLNIKLIPAEYGDCILISIDGKKNFNILVDGGTSKTYKEFIKKEIENIENLGQKLDLIICTHIDYDHIGGLTQLLINTDSKNIGSVWYNGFLQVINSKYYIKPENKYSFRDNKILDDIISKGTQYDGRQEIGINQGISLGVLLEEKKISVNSIVCGKTISTEFVDKPVKISEDTELYIIGPAKEKIKELENYWVQEMIARNYMFRVSNKLKLMEAFEYYLEAIKSFYKEEEIKVSRLEELEKYFGNLDEVDHSVTNRSSISFILNHKKNNYLFLGDTNIDEIILKNIENVVGYKYKFKAIKFPHHGSRYNITHEFIKRYKAEEYYCLTNSERFGHPDLEVISAVICNDSSFKRIFFNYPIYKANVINNKDWKDKYNYDIVIGNGKSPIERNFE